MQDDDAYYKYPQHRKWFNKLHVAELFGYDCGPSGTAPTKDGVYITRPIFNLSGMGLGAEVKGIKAGDTRATPPGHFWCEYLTGKHYSANYTFVHDTKSYWKPISCWEGFNTPVNMIQFIEWKRSDYIPEVPRELNDLSNVGEINVEFKGGDIIEVHLRTSSDPDYDHFIPVWSSDLGKKKAYMEAHGYEFLESYDNADGHLDDPRIGFLVK